MLNSRVEAVDVIHMCKVSFVTFCKFLINENLQESVTTYLENGHLLGTDALPLSVQMFFCFHVIFDKKCR